MKYSTRCIYQVMGFQQFSYDANPCYPSEDISLTCLPLDPQFSNFLLNQYYCQFKSFLKNHIEISHLLPIKSLRYMNMYYNIGTLATSIHGNEVPLYMSWSMNTLKILVLDPYDRYLYIVNTSHTTLAVNFWTIFPLYRPICEGKLQFSTISHICQVILINFFSMHSCLEDFHLCSDTILMVLHCIVCSWIKPNQPLCVTAKYQQITKNLEWSSEKKFYFVLEVVIKIMTPNILPQRD